MLLQVGDLENVVPGHGRRRWLRLSTDGHVDCSYTAG
jgi:hypothetical protein